jgi:septal ring factor EnvC (AmiA/AmiB activator)
MENKNSFKEILKKNKKAYGSIFVCLFVAYALLIAGITNTGNKVDDNQLDYAAEEEAEASDNSSKENEPTVTQKPAASEKAEEKTEVNASDEDLSETEVAEAGSSDVLVTDNELDGGGLSEEISEAAAEKESSKANTVAFDEEKGIIMPIEGEILIDYSMDHGVYYETLEQFMTSDGILIDAGKGDIAVACCDAVVTAIYSDTRRGQCVELTAGDYTFTYGQLASVSVSLGSTVKEGSAVGMVGDPTKYFSKEGTHLYFRTELGENVIDPTELLASSEGEDN